MGVGHPFEGLFRSENIRRDAYRSRLFGRLSEEVVRHWCANDRAPYIDRDRPTLWSDTNYATLDQKGLVAKQERTRGIRACQPSAELRQVNAHAVGPLTDTTMAYAAPSMRPTVSRCSVRSKQGSEHPWGPMWQWSAGRLRTISG